MRHAACPPDACRRRFMSEKSARSLEAGRRHTRALVSRLEIMRVYGEIASVEVRGAAKPRYARVTKIPPRKAFQECRAANQEADATFESRYTRCAIAPMPSPVFRRRLPL